MVWLLILSIFLATDTVEVKGTTGLSYRLFINQNKLCFQYKLGKNWSEPTKLDSGNISEYSAIITAGDYLHVVWRKENSIYYITTLEPVDPSAIRQGIQPVWSEIVPISEPEQTEPASNPFVEAQGEWVYAVWRGPNQEGNSDYGEIWQRRRRMDWPVEQWTTPKNKSRIIYRN